MFNWVNVLYHGVVDYFKDKGLEGKKFYSDQWPPELSYVTVKGGVVYLKVVDQDEFPTAIPIEAVGFYVDQGYWVPIK